MPSEADVGGTAREVVPSHKYFITFCLTKWYLAWKFVWNKGVELNSSMQKKMAPTDIHQCLLNVYGYQTVDVNTVKQLVVHFSSSKSDSGSSPLA